ncbi:MAG: TIGR03087 family PEP-CTERM/XrtA system glycosyltransferase [Planctomycetes bacterium]|nr:TIGR03087 family PEP-CTERM/XrtA system glycosyltransferase [Planctomycetota bacterium]
MNVLFLAQRVPYPPNRGDKITTWRIVERLQRAHRVRIVAFAHDAGDEKAAGELRAKGFEVATFAPSPRWRSLPLLLGSTPLTLGVYGSRALEVEVDRVIGDTDLAYAYSSSMGAFFLRHDVPRVMHFAELDSDKWRQYAQMSSFPLSWVYRREWRTLRGFETELAHAVDENVFCTPLEQAIFQREIPGASSLVMRNGVDLAHYQPSEATREPALLVFVGVMNYYPNVEGIAWFCREILPEVQRRVPGAKLAIVGSHPTDEVKALAKLPGVEVTGFVDDPRTYLARAAVSVAPLRIARGIQNKVLEAMAMGLALVGTRSATQGVEGEHGRDFLVAESAAEQVEAVCALLADAQRARELGRRARAFVEANYDWEVCLRPLDQLLEKHGKKR